MPESKLNGHNDKAEESHVKCNRQAHAHCARSQEFVGRLEAQIIDMRNKNACCEGDSKGRHEYEQAAHDESKVFTMIDWHVEACNLKKTELNNTNIWMLSCRPFDQKFPS